MASLIGFIRRNWTINHPPQPAKSPEAIRVGVFGASWIAPMALIIPAKSHQEVIIAAVAARDPLKAADYAKKHNIPKVHKSYNDLLDDATIDAVYIPLPNGLHFEWAVKALKAGKHVLLEKPFTSNAGEAQKLVDFYESLPSPRPVLLEAFHYMFHPAWHEFLSLLSPPDVISVTSSQTIFSGFFKKDDIRFNYSLSGGTLMDLGTYNVSTLRQVYGTEPIECTSAKARLLPKGRDQECDEAFHGEWKFPNGGTGTIDADIAMKNTWGLPTINLPQVLVEHKAIVMDDGANAVAGQIHTRTRTATYWAFSAPHAWHRIDILDKHIIKDKDGNIVKSWQEKENKKAYIWAEAGKGNPNRNGDDYWSTYRHMLEQFVNKIKGREGSGVWVSGEDSVNQMKLIDEAYLKAGLPLRPSSTYM